MKSFIAFAAGVAAVVAALVVIGAEERQEEAQGQEGDRYAELVKQKGAFSETFVLPGVNFGKFDKVYFWEAQFEYRDVGPARRTRSTLLSTRKREFGISEEDRRRFEEIVGDAFRKEITRAKEFRIVEDIDEIDGATLIARGGLLDIVSVVPPEFVGRSDIYLSSVGAATFVMEMIDASTGAVVALVAERREIETLNNRSGMAAVRATSASIMGDIRRWSGSIARRLREGLDQAIREDAEA